MAAVTFIAKLRNSYQTTVSAAMARLARKNRRQQTQQRPPRTEAATVVAVMAGLGLSLLAVGYVESYYWILDFSPLTFRLSLGVLILSVALGPRLSLRAAMAVAQWVQQHVTRTPQDSGDSPEETQTQTELLWTVVGVVGLAAGLAALALPVFIFLSERFYSWGTVAFLWTSWPLTFFDAIVMLLAALIPFSMLGLFIRCIHQLCCPPGCWRTQTSAWVLIGAAIGLLAVAILCGFPPPGALLLRIGAAPLFVAAMISVWKAAPRKPLHVGPYDLSKFKEPDIGERWPTVLRLAVAIVVGACATTGIVWTHALGLLHPNSTVACLGAAAGMILAVAVGMAVASRRWSSMGRWIGSFGMLCAAAGAALAAGLVLFTAVTRISCAGFADTPGHWLLWGACVCLPLGLAGYAVGYGAFAVLRRSPRQSTAGAGLLQLILLAVGSAALFVALPALELVGSYAALVAMSLAMLAVGGILVIHEPTYSSRLSMPRVGIILTTVLLMTWIMPPAGSSWLGNRQQPRGALAESWWMSYDLSSGKPQLLGANSGQRLHSGLTQLAGEIDWDDLPSDWRIGVVLANSEQPDLNGATPAIVEEYTLEPQMRSRLQASFSNGSAEDDRAHSRIVHPLAALRLLRSSSWHYDLLVMSLAELPPRLQMRSLASPLFARAFNRVGPDGALVALLPNDPGSLFSPDRVAAALIPAGARQEYITTVTSQDGHSTLLICGRSRAWNPCDIMRTSNWPSESPSDQDQSAMSTSGDAITPFSAG